MSKETTTISVIQTHFSGETETATVSTDGVQIWDVLRAVRSALLAGGFAQSSVDEYFTAKEPAE